VILINRVSKIKCDTKSKSVLHVFLAYIRYFDKTVRLKEGSLNPQYQ